MKERKGNKKNKALSESYVDAVMSAENVVGYTTGRWQKKPDRQRNPPKEILSLVKRTISLIRQGKKFKIKNYKHKHTKKTNKQINGKHKMQCANILEIIQSL